MGRSQIVSVPYAMVAKSVENQVGFWGKIGDVLYYNSGPVGIGTDSPNSQLEVHANPGTHIDSALFEVKNIDGETVFAVYNEGVRVFV